MKAVIYFEDAKKVSDSFEEQLNSYLRLLGKSNQVQFRFVPYFIHPAIPTHPRPPEVVARDAARWVMNKTLDKLALVVDLNPSIEDQDVGFGLRVVSKLVTDESTAYFKSSLGDFLSYSEYLVIVCSVHTSSLSQAVSADPEWSTVRGLRFLTMGAKPQVTTIEEKKNYIDAEVSKAILELRKPGPRILVAAREDGDAQKWMQITISKWI